ncbi:PAK4-inhibitor INKA2-like [Chanos chanos]|uniref:PAK4-inhibitor INKA2 n=1 Tax=Chanos chanos TaxID=29144 RepID=A0A6J2VS93_CHACN|nr:PAK4-inhibitor INKA2-like [Chanos chanos]
MDHLSKSERKNMDTCLRRLKQELLSMKEAGDGLHAQMNSMMGALQELKLLQVQTALERLEISGRPGQTAQLPTETDVHCPNQDPQDHRSQLVHEDQLNTQHFHCNSLETSPSSSSLESESLPLSRRVSGYSAPQVDFCGPRLSYMDMESKDQHQCPSNPANLTHPANPPQVVDLSSILHSLSREGPSLDNNYSQDSLDDSSDWTSSLMSRSRNRQPLVLGDNVFADLVGNWLDLPEVERYSEEEEQGGGRPDSPAHPLRLSRSQELCRRLSLTTNIFKKFLRSVRPDRDKLLKEKPGWMPLDHNPQAELFKRPKKVAKNKGGFYLPFWAGGQQSKGRACSNPTEERNQYSGIYIDRRQAENVETMHPSFDYSTAVWV